MGAGRAPRRPAAGRLLDAFPAGVLPPMWAHLSLRLTDWAIRHFAPAEVGHWLDLAEQRMT